MATFTNLHPHLDDSNTNWTPVAALSEGGWPRGWRRIVSWAWWLGCSAFSVVAIRWSLATDVHWLAWAGTLVAAISLWGIAFVSPRSSSWRVWTIAWVLGGGAWLSGIGHAAWAIGLWTAWAVIAMSAGTRGRWPGWWMAAGSCALVLASWSSWPAVAAETRVGALSTATPAVHELQVAVPHRIRPQTPIDEVQLSHRTSTPSGGRGW